MPLPAATEHPVCAQQWRREVAAIDRQPQSPLALLRVSAPKLWRFSAIFERRSPSPANALPPRDRQMEGAASSNLLDVDGNLRAKEVPMTSELIVMPGLTRLDPQTLVPVADEFGWEV